MIWDDLLGTSNSSFGVGFTGPLLKNVTGDLEVRDDTDSSYVVVVADSFKATGNTGLVINSDAAGAGADWKISIARPSSGMTADWTLTLPVDAGTAGYALVTDGAGNTSWAAVAATDICVKEDVTNVAFGSSSTISAFTAPTGSTIRYVQVIIDTSFDGTANLSVGISGNASKYMASTQSVLQKAAKVSFFSHPGEAALGAPEAIEIAYSAGGASAGAARVIVGYSTPA